jgi:hypothetical protein
MRSIRIQKAFSLKIRLQLVLFKIVISIESIGFFKNIS